MKNRLHLIAVLFTLPQAFAQVPDSVLRELLDDRTYFSKTYYNTRDNTYVTRVSASYEHYLASDGRFKDIDTNLKLDKSGTYYVIDTGLYNVAFAAAIGAGNWDVAYEVPRPVHEKFRDPGKPPAPVTRVRWKVLSYGYWESTRNRYQIIDYAKAVAPVVSRNSISYPQIFNGIDARYLCQNTSVKEEIILSQSARKVLPDPAKYGLSRNNSYFVVAMEFLLTPNNINVFARRQGNKTPIKQGNDFVFNGDEAIEFEDENTTLHFFFPKDYAYATADSVTDFANRANLKRVFFSQGGKNYLLVGVPWAWINSSPAGDLIIDPTTNAATNEDVRLYDAGNYGSDTKLAVGKFPNASQLKSRSIINFNLTGIPSNATVLNAQMKLRYYEKYNNTTGIWVDRWIQAHQLLLGWDEAQADSLERSTSVNWAAARGKIGGATPDANGSYESTLLIVEDEALPVWKSWDLTALTQKWVSGAVANYGVLLWATNENASGYVLRFYSSEATNTSDRPYLEVIWSQTPQTVYFLKDHLGSIRATVSDSGKAAMVIGFDDYDPWGYPLATRMKTIPSAYMQGASKNKFTENEYDDDFGINWGYHIDRFYDHQVGRWWVVDPVQQYSLSPYVYGANNPVRFIDPFGADTLGSEKKPVPLPGVLVTPIEQGLIKPRPGRLFGLAFLSIGETTGLNDIIRVQSGVDPFSLRQLSTTERVIAGISAATLVIPNPRITIKITGKGLAHVIERHTIDGISKFVKKSKFASNVNIVRLVEQANNVTPISQSGGRLAWIVDAGTNIGVDRTTGQATRIYTVITEGTGELVTAFPGRP